LATASLASDETHHNTTLSPTNCAHRGFPGLASYVVESICRSDTDCGLDTDPSGAGRHLFGVAEHVEIECGIEFEAQFVDSSAQLSQ
jgi:hypothetical protein